MIFTPWISWIHSFFTPVYDRREMHGFTSSLMVESTEDLENTKFTEIIYKIKKYDILGDNDYECIKSLPIVKKVEILRTIQPD